MELHNDEVPGDTVWALVFDFGNRGMITIDWFLTAEASSEDYRNAVEYMKTHSGGTCQRWKVTLPRRRMDRQAVGDYVLFKLSEDPDGTAQLLDINVRPARD